MEEVTIDCPYCGKLIGKHITAGPIPTLHYCSDCDAWVSHPIEENTLPAGPEVDLSDGTR
jgi:hypothetical protein